MGNSFGTITKLPSGNWRARYTHNFVRYAAPHTFPTKKLAGEWLAGIQADIVHGRWLPPKAAEQRRKEAELAKEREAYTFGEFAAGWSRKLEEEGKSPNTVRTYRSHLRRHILPFFEHLPLRGIAPADVRRWWDRFDPATPGARFNAYRTLSAIFGAAVEAEMIPASPAKVKGALSFKRAGERTAITPELVEGIVEGMPGRLRVAVYLAAYCGLRYGEVAGLQRQDIDVVGGTVAVRRAIKRAENGELVVGPPKTAAGTRVLAIPAGVIPIIAHHLDAFVLPPAEAWLVTTERNPYAPISNNSLHRAYGPACDAAGIPGFSFHELRHTHLTWLGRAGATNAELMHRAGHSTVGTVMIYQHADAERDRALVAAIDPARAGNVVPIRKTS